MSEAVYEVLRITQPASFRLVFSKVREGYLSRCYEAALPLGACRFKQAMPAKVPRPLRYLFLNSASFPFRARLFASCAPSYRQASLRPLLFACPSSEFLRHGAG